MEEDTIKVGDTIKLSRTEYEIIAEFEDDGNKYWVGKCHSGHANLYYYSNIFTYDKNGKLFKRS